MQKVRNTKNVRFFTRISTFISVMLARKSKLKANSESASKSELDQPQGEIAQPHTDRFLAGEECDLAPKTAIGFQS